ncbi:MAG TPA: dihydropteroate synthase [Solirubrobacteraceae bacterium]|nr:dihydropteroate synthase [Solirubrobacteraceae bacterium]
MSDPGGYRLMGIVNATPDSFSDGGLFLEPRVAVDHACALIEQGAEIVDVGGESTRPGALAITAEEELRRVLPVVEGIVARTGADAKGPIQVSIDTSKSAVARAALASGASLVNDVSALRADPEMASVVAESGADCCLVHMLGLPGAPWPEPRYEDVVDEVRSALEERMAFAVREGISEERLLLDPGIGFGKTVEHNLTLLQRLQELVALGPPIVIGTSRKSFLGRIGGREAGSARLGGTIASNVMALERGARVFRVHDVAPLREALAVATATLAGRWTESSGARNPTTETS